MSVNQILPIIIPGILIQLSIQIYYIWHCWEKSSLTQKEKAWWIVAMAIFNLPAAAIYLIVTRKKSEFEAIELNDEKIDPNIKQAVSILLYLSYMIFSITIMFNNYERLDFFVIAILLSVNFILIFASWYVNDNRGKFFHYFIPVLSLGVASYINFMDDFSTTTLIVLVVAANIINNHRLKQSKIYAVVGFFLFVGLETAGLYRTGVTVSFDEIVGFIYLNAVIYLLVFAAFYLLKRQLMMNNRLQELVNETREQGKALEEMTAISERNKIAGEIHDTVGHSLTTALISIDAARKSISNDDSDALAKIDDARNQIKKGMDEIRYSVRAVKHGTGKEDFRETFPRMVEELQKSSGIELGCILQINENLIPLHRTFFYRITKECVTNSMKHGNSSEADILLSEYKGILNFTYSDNGKGTDEIKEGYGLSNIRSMCESLGGSVSYTSSEGEGFTTNLSIPLGREKRNE